MSYLWEEGGGLTKNILSYLENVTFDLGREGLKANFGNVMIYAGIFHGNRPLAPFIIIFVFMHISQSLKSASGFKSKQVERALRAEQL